MSDTRERDGAVWHSGQVSILDTREMGWHEHPGLPGGRIKVLSADADGVPMVMLNWLPPVLAPHAPERHFHRSVSEHGFVLFGELPIREYESVEDEAGQLVRFRSGYYYHRRPGSVHGVDRRAHAPGIGFLILEWRSGPGTYLWEDGVERETTSLALPEGVEQPAQEALANAGGVVRERDNLTIVDTRRMTWQDHPGIPGAKSKVLTAQPDGTPMVMLNWMPPVLETRPPERHYHRTVLERGYVLAGHLPHREYADMEDRVGHAVPFESEYYYERQPGSVHGLDPGQPSYGLGFLILEWRTGAGTYLSEAAAAQETLSVPLEE